MIHGQFFRGKFSPTVITDACTPFPFPPLGFPKLPGLVFFPPDVGRVRCTEKNILHGYRIAYFPFLSVSRKEGEMCRGRGRSWSRNGSRNGASESASPEGDQAGQLPDFTQPQPWFLLNLVLESSSAWGNGVGESGRQRRLGCCFGPWHFVPLPGAAPDFYFHASMSRNQLSHRPRSRGPKQQGTGTFTLAVHCITPLLWLDAQVSGHLCAFIPSAPRRVPTYCSSFVSVTNTPIWPNPSHLDPLVGALN